MINIIEKYFMGESYPIIGEHNPVCYDWELDTVLQNQKMVSIVYNDLEKGLCSSAILDHCFL